MVSRTKLISWLGEAKGIHAKDSFFLSSWFVPPPRQQDCILEHILPSKPKRAGVGGYLTVFFDVFHWCWRAITSRKIWSIPVSYPFP